MLRNWALEEPCHHIAGLTSPTSRSICFSLDPIQLILCLYSIYQPNEILVSSCHHEALKKDPVTGSGLRGSTHNNEWHSDRAISIWLLPGDTRQAKHPNPPFSSTATENKKNSHSYTGLTIPPLTSEGRGR